jgi:hypothetical protein
VAISREKVPKPTDIAAISREKVPKSTDIAAISTEIIAVTGRKKFFIGRRIENRVGRRPPA